MGAVLNGDVAVGQVVGNNGDVASHGRRWVSQRGTELDGEAVCGISVVGSPVLGPVVEKARIEATTARSAALPKNIGVLGGQRVDNVVDTKHVSVVI